MPCSGIWAIGKWTRVQAGEDRIISDSEDNTLVAGRGKAGKEGGRATEGTKENQPQPFPLGARSSLGTWTRPYQQPERGATKQSYIYLQEDARQIKFWFSLLQNELMVIYSI